MPVLNRPVHFRDEQIKGAFTSFAHDHYFHQFSGYTLMVDNFHFESPGGIFGHIFNKMILTQYMENFLKLRNDTIKKYAESDRWKTIL